MSYQQLCTEFYNRSKPFAGEKEIAFYEKTIREANGPILEAMCGSGRLLIPLIEKGYEVDGVDNSSEMLMSCKERLNGLKANLYHQSLLKLSLSKQYGIIFIAVGSFQLFSDREDAKKVLENLLKNLQPKGVLLIETYIPWDEIHQGQTELHYEKEVSLEEDSRIFLKGKTIIDQIEQLEISDNLYEKHKNGNIVGIEQEQLAVRWYYREEMELLLQSAGFSNIQIIDESFELNPQAIIYRAEKQCL